MKHVCQCPRCPLRFASMNEVRGHLREDHRRTRPLAQALVREEAR